MRTLLRLPFLAVLLLAFATPARADDDADTEVAKRRFRVGAAFYEQGEYEKALEEFGKARIAKPLPAFDYNIARCHDRLGQWTEALAEFERFAASSHDEKDRQEALVRIPILRARIAELTNKATADEHFGKATRLLNASQFPAAIEELKLAYQAVPDAMHLYNLAQAYRLEGDSGKAIATYERYLREAPNSPLRHTVEVRIAALKDPGAMGKAPVKQNEVGAVVKTDSKLPDAGAATSELPPAPGGAIASERLKSVTEVIKTNRAGFRACFDLWSKRNPGVAGKVKLSFYLDPDGVLNQAEADTQEFTSPEVSFCIVDYARTLAYPAAPNGRFTHFSYPFDFKPK